MINNNLLNKLTSEDSLKKKLLEFPTLFYGVFSSIDFNILTKKITIVAEA